MNKIVTTTFMIIGIIFLNLNTIMAQDIPIKPNKVITGVFLGETPPLRDLPPITAAERHVMDSMAVVKMEEKAKKGRTPRSTFPYKATALPQGPDPVWQKNMGKSAAGGTKAPIVNFDAQTTTSYPPDCNGTIGPNHYMQTINLTYAIYNRSGTLVAGPTAMNTLFSGVTGSTYNNGDPLIHWDEQAQRWIAVEFSVGGTNDYMLVAVSTTNDPTGTWYKYSFDVADMPDYEKIGVWHDGYYMATNTGTGNDVYVLERSKMLTGATAQMIAFDNTWRPGFGFMLVPPLDNDGPAAPASTHGTFIAFNDDAVGGGSDQLWLYELVPNWTTPASSTFVRTQMIDVAAFDSQFTQDWNDITTPNGQNLDGVPAVIMNAPQYRNFGTYQTIVCCHTVDVDNTNHAGVRWYELRKTPPETTWSVRQQGTYAPDQHSRWMASVMLNGDGKIGMGYSISSATVYPGIRYTGQSASAYAAANGLMDIPEGIIQNGTIAQTTYNRWGDYSLLSVDPNDDKTFWYTNEYMKTAPDTKGTRIASFKFTNAPNAITRSATSLTGTTATLNGTVNPNSIATDYHFEWGTTVSYGNSTATVSAGSGMSDILVNAGITGLSAGNTYHFRLVATNSDGTTNGDDMTFVFGTAVVKTTAISNLGSSSVVTGGEITTDGGYPVTARGVCWGTSINPVATGNHTTDGTGIGTFVSTITGLTMNTTYHVRAYATTANGTFYGSDLIFTTYCGPYYTPLTQGFPTTSMPACWTQADIFGDGYTWQFGSFSGPSGFTAPYAYMRYSSGTLDCDLITPTLDLSALSSVTLSFKHYYRHAAGRSAKLSYSIDDGSTWTLLQSYSTSTTNPATYNQVINAVAGHSEVKFKWNFSGTGATTTYWVVDDVSITGTSCSPGQWLGNVNTD